MRTSILIPCVLVVLSQALPCLAETPPTGRELLDRAADALFSAAYVTRVDTTEKTSTVLAGDRQIPQPPEKSEMTIEIDRHAHSARDTFVQGGQKVVVLKHEEGAAVKVGNGPWALPAGPYRNLARSLGDLFVCEREVPETTQDASNWKVVGFASLDGVDCDVVEGDFPQLAEERMTRGITQAFQGDPRARPSVKVKSYVSRHWLAKAIHARVQCVQTSTYVMTVPQPDGKSVQIETVNVATSHYRYGKVPIEVPPEARAAMADLGQNGLGRPPSRP